MLTLLSLYHFFRRKCKPNILLTLLRDKLKSVLEEVNSTKIGNDSPLISWSFQKKLERGGREKASCNLTCALKATCLDKTLRLSCSGPLLNRHPSRRAKLGHPNGFTLHLEVMPGKKFVPQNEDTAIIIALYFAANCCWPHMNNKKWQEYKGRGVGDKRVVRLASTRVWYERDTLRRK